LGQRASQSGESYGRSSSLPETIESHPPPLSREPDDSSGGRISRIARFPHRAVLRLRGQGLLLPSAVSAGLFFLVPLALLLVYSFGSVNLLDYQVYFGWTISNYTSIIRSIYLGVMLRSLALSLGATLACLLIGFPVAYTIARARGRRQAVLLVMVMVPFWTSFIVRTYGIYNVISYNGPLDRLLNAIGLVHGQLQSLLFQPAGIGIGIVYSYLPLMVLPIYVALERIEPNLLLAASDLGAGPRRVLRRVVVPLAAPGIVAGCILVGIPATGEYTIPAILGGGKAVMYGNVVSDQFLSLGNYPFGSAIAMTLTVLILAVLLWLRSRAAKVESRTSR
jgi:ABC-type spermidine/putrescine transport system permease subunit I